MTRDSEQDGSGSTDHDSPWKEALEHYLEQAMALLFPHLHERIDWSKGFLFRDGELQQIVREAESGRRYTDKLVEVYADDGEPTWILLHVEVQGEPEKAFAERMFTYYYRLYDRYQRDVVSVAVLTDTSPSFRPESYRYERLGCGLHFWFPVAKLLDWQQRWSELEADPNPFACVVMAQLAAKGERDPHRRKDAKLQLTRLLLERGYSKDETRALIRIMDWIINLPEGLDAEYVAEVRQLAEEYKMPFVTSFERVGEKRGEKRGEKKGRREHAVETLLRQIARKFGPEAKEASRARIERAGAGELEMWLDRILDAERLDDVFADD
ncbi:hypothetical protein [Halorhodospira halochloris]|uniref:hypothetical protein n=1 Tax=Halorhodospira halochloris TaxID=1052 RepID=UPI001EE88C5C|nr:hypothetical protein [Halorhodospira halochloris]MCG5548394.1 hypothetical protein [Halorhodospira halochloris]